MGSWSLLVSFRQLISQLSHLVLSHHHRQTPTGIMHRLSEAIQPTRSGAHEAVTCSRSQEHASALMAETAARPLMIDNCKPRAQLICDHLDTLQQVC